MVSYLERNSSDGSEGDNDRRKATRASLLATVTAIPLSRTFEPCGEPFKAAARDASAGGMSLLHTRAVNAEHFALRWQSLASQGSKSRSSCRSSAAGRWGRFTRWPDNL